MRLLVKSQQARCLPSGFFVLTGENLVLGRLFGNDAAMFSIIPA
ncbi:hypothetical protein O59_002641 [Cellvibrio sp. BR]|nr:hypothetical protein O59_002641 [Cellvibrio sp. BR]